MKLCELYANFNEINMQPKRPMFAPSFHIRVYFKFAVQEQVATAPIMLNDAGGRW
jgi:hypothetical protein